MVTSRHHRQTQLAEQLGRIVAYIELNLLVHGSQVVIAAQVDSLDNLSKIC